MPNIYFQVGQSVRSDSEIYYRVLEFLGNGANAYAYRCLCTSGVNRGIQLVIKIQYNLSSERRRERFLAEAAFLRDCRHPAILRQHDTGTFVTTQNRFPFIVTNFMPETLSRRLAANSITFEQKVKYSCQLLSAVTFLQSQSIVHRDIKPNNIFISGDNAILGDFGLIKRIEPHSCNDDDDVALVNETVMRDLTGYVAMARYYRTPELVNYANQTDDLRIETDVFQLGLVLAEMFTGRNPLHPTGDLRSPIVLEDVGYVGAPRAGRIIRDTLTEMLRIDYRERMSIGSAMDRFTGIHE